jgi:hypothetical protein
MPRRVQILQQSDFTGGLNYRDDSFTLEPSQTPSSVNVRLLPQGGFHRRKTLHWVNDTPATFTAARNLWSFFGNGVTQVLVQDGNDAYYGTGGAVFTAINPDALATTGKMRAATMARVGTASSERCYIQRNAEQVAWKWSGSAATVLADAAAAFNDNLAAPAGGRMPVARYIATHAGFMFHAYTVEGGTTYANRIRWSHPGEPEDYRTLDYIDVGIDHDGDVITGICSLESVLYIFKNRSVWALTGYDADTFQLVKVVDGVGAVSQEAICHSQEHVYFFDHAKGVFTLKPQRVGSEYSTAPSRVAWLWDKLSTRLEAGTIPSAYRSGITMAWMDNRVWCAVPWSGETENSHVFVFDPQLSKEGGWYLYVFADVVGGIKVGPMHEWAPANVTPRFLGITSSGTIVAEFEYDQGTADAIGSSGLVQSSPYTSHLVTSWFHAGFPGVKKRWRRPTFVVDADDDATIGVKAYVDYSSLTPQRSGSISVTGAVGGSGVWNSSTWNGTTWTSGTTGDQDIIRGSAFGNAFALQLRFDGPQDVHWGINAIDLRYIPQRIR